MGEKMKSAERRIELPMGDPPLYVVIDAPRAAGNAGPSWLRFDDTIALVHVISRASGGECRGYWLVEGVLHVRHPVSPRDWPELDEAVSRATGLRVVDRAALAEKDPTP